MGTSRGAHPISGCPAHPGVLRHPPAQLSPPCARGDAGTQRWESERRHLPWDGAKPRDTASLLQGRGKGSAPLRPRPTHRAAGPAPGPTRAGVWGDEGASGATGGSVGIPRGMPGDSHPAGRWRRNPPATPRAGSCPSPQAGSGQGDLGVRGAGAAAELTEQPGRPEQGSERWEQPPGSAGRSGRGWERKINHPGGRVSAGSEGVQLGCANKAPDGRTDGRAGS